MKNFWEEPNSLNPGADFGEGQTLEPEEATTLANNSRLAQERALGSWRSFKLPQLDATSIRSDITNVSYSSILDSCVLWSRGNGTSDIQGHVITESGSQGSMGWLTTNSAAVLSIVGNPFNAFIGDSASRNLMVVAHNALNGASHYFKTSVDHGQTWLNATDPGESLAVTEHPLTPGGAPDRIFFFGAAINHIWSFTSSSATIVTGADTGYLSAAHNGLGVCLIVGATGYRRSLDYGLTWVDWTMPFPTGTGITSPSLATISYDEQRGEFVLVRAAMFGGEKRLFVATTGDGSTWSAWHMLPQPMQANTGWVKLLCGYGAWAVFYFRWGRFLSMAWSVDQGQTWRTSDIAGLPPSVTASAPNPVLMPATGTHGAHFVVANPWVNGSAYIDREVFISDQIAPSTAQFSSIVS
jgi:hypothetical protein